MIFRPSVIAQPKPKRVNRKPIVSSLLTDPAFSADPYEHPYAVTSHEPWLTSPPAGHPTLSTRKAKRVLADDSDSEPFHLIQPPNSPVNFAGPSDSLSISISNSTLSPTSSTQQSEESHSLPASSSQKPRSPVLTTEPSPSPSPPLPPPPPALPSPPPPVDQKNSQRKPERSFMTFLKRRSTQQPESSSVGSKTKNNPSKEPRSARIGNNVQAVPRHPTEPNLHNVESLVLPPRASTLGFSTPATVSASSLTGSALSKRRASDAPNSRVKDLDSIDELDETNPWGIALHHGGPYEAATQVIRGKSKQVYAGHGSYNRGAPALGSNYAPPQAIGLSLNLSPGQILPRNMYSLYGEATQPRQRAAPKDLVSPPMAVMMIPSNQTPPLPSCLQSGFTTPMQSSASLPQTHQGGPSTTPPRHLPHDSKPAPQVNHPLPQNLPSAGSSARPPPSTVPIFQPSSQPVLKKVPRKPVKQDHEKPVSNVSIGIGMAMLDGESEEDSEESKSESSASRDASQTSLEANDFQQVDPHSEKPQFLVMAPDLSSPIDHPLESPPPPYILQTNADRPAEQGRSQTSSQRSTNSSPSLTPANASGGNAVVSNVSLHAGRDGEVTPKTLITTSKQSNVRQGTSAGPPQPARGNLVRLHPVESGSIHQSISTLSSSQSRSVGSPRPRHIPKHLVMPAPLSQPNMAPQPRHIEYRHTIHSRQSHYLPARQIPSQTVEPPPRPSERTLHERMRPANTVVKAQAEEIPFTSAKVAKLKKRVSMISPASPSYAPPVITTVSFAPPIIDFKNPVSNDNDLQRVVMNKLPKRVLSKRVW